MNAMDVIVLCLIGLTVLIVSIIQYIESVQESSHEEEEKSVCAEREAENQEISENLKSADFRKVVKVNKEENPACVSGQKLDFSRWILSITENNGDDISGENREIIDQESDSCSGFSGISENNMDDICGKKGIIEDNDNNGEEEDEFVDDWEGIERTELEKIFGEALIFVNCKSNADKIGDLKLQLYGLQRVALDGPCHKPQPMALKVSSRSKWNAWQKLGNMSRETAMQMYVDVLSKAIPHWKGEEDTLTNQDDTASSSSSSSSSVSVSSVSVCRPKCGPITEDEIRDVLSDKTQPMTTYDLVMKFRSRMKSREEKDAFAAILKRIAMIPRTNEAKKYIVLKGDMNSALPTE